jgi:3-deoxy-D-manno-octulosonate 8-phosphate phosphatase KdsC-like HAD superfamily phosphatase
MEIHLLTGDNKRTAHAVAGELGIEPTQTHAEAFPEQKVTVVKDLHDGGKTVAFVGDGINDSPALAYADVSVSFGNGSDVARETADVVLMENNLRGLPEAIAIARQAMQLIHQNTGIVAIPNLAALVLAVVVGIDPLAATIVNNGSTVVAGLNGLRPLLSEQLDQLAASLDSNGNDQDSEASQTLEEVTNGSSQQPSNEVLESLEQSLETRLNDSSSVISEPPNTLESTQAVSDSLGVVTEHLTAKALAYRLNVSATTISKRKSKPDFPEWARSKDPEGILWTYSKKSHHFVALVVTVA